MVEEKRRKGECECGEEERVWRGTENRNDLFGGKLVGHVKNTFVEAEN